MRVPTTGQIEGEGGAIQYRVGIPHILVTRDREEGGGFRLAMGGYRLGASTGTIVVVVLPITRAIWSAMVWMQLPQLPVKLWGLAMLHGIINLAGKLVMVDDCTVKYKHISFIQICLRIDLSWLLRFGVLINSPKGSRW